MRLKEQRRLPPSARSLVMSAAIVGAATHPGQTDESADNKTGEWIEPVHDRYTSARESGFRSFRSASERGHQRAGYAASFVVPVRSQPAPGASSLSLGAVPAHHERSEFGRMQVSRRPNQR